MFISPTPGSIDALLSRDIQGSVTMLNLLRFRTVADYREFPELEPDEPISGEQAYGIYSSLTVPHLEAVGGSVAFMGNGGALLVGPEEARWDLVLLVQYPDIAAFLSMTQNPAYLEGAGHRAAALEDSRLLPIA
jgi:uncharacterized protein (DUF1330 family)